VFFKKRPTAAFEFVGETGRSLEGGGEAKAGPGRMKQAVVAVKCWCSGGQLRMQMPLASSKAERSMGMQTAPTLKCGQGPPIPVCVLVGGPRIFSPTPQSPASARKPAVSVLPPKRWNAIEARWALRYSSRPLPYPRLTDRRGGRFEAYGAKSAQLLPLEGKRLGSNFHPHPG